MGRGRPTWCGVHLRTRPRGRERKAILQGFAGVLQLDGYAQVESLLRGRKRELGIDMDFDSGRSRGQALAFSHGIDVGRGGGLGL